MGIHFAQYETDLKQTLLNKGWRFYWARGFLGVA